MAEVEVIWARATDASQRAAAFRRLADDQLHDSYRLAGAILGSPIDARDAVHDAFITAWQAWPTLRDPERFETWFRRIVVNTCRDRLRQAMRHRSSDISSGPDHPVADLSRDVDDRLLLEDGLARLKPDDRIVLALRYYHDLRVDDIAAVLDIPAGTVKSRLHHAHARLRAVMDRSQRGSASR